MTGILCSYVLDVSVVSNLEWLEGAVDYTVRNIKLSIFICELYEILHITISKERQVLSRIGTPTGNIVLGREILVVYLECQ